jgi:hypothetical protein
MTIRYESGNAAALGIADWLCLAAAPTFAVMALMTAVLGSGPPHILCSAARDASPLSGMVPMYLLMSAFHAAPWLKLIYRQRNGARRLLLIRQQVVSRMERTTKGTGRAT